MPISNSVGEKDLQLLISQLICKWTKCSFTEIIIDEIQDSFKMQFNALRKH